MIFRDATATVGHTPLVELGRMARGLAVRVVAKLEMRSIQHLVGLFLLHRNEVKHPDPPLALSFALMMLTSTLVELILSDHDLKYWQTVIPKDDQSLKRELLRSFLSYLGIEHKNN